MSRFFTGLLMGIGVGLLIAPEKGEATRDSLAETATTLRDKFNRMVGRAGAQIDDVKDLLGSEIEGLSEDVRNRILSIIDEESARRGNHTAASGYKSEVRPV
jgi:gas vesicle protein